MDSLLHGSPVVVIAFWVAVLTITMSCLLLAGVVLLRMRALRRERRDFREREHWTQVLKQELAGASPPVRRLDARQAHGFIEAWNTVHESLPEADSRRLAALGERVGLVDAARRQLDGRYHDRAMVIIALGHLRDPQLFDELSGFLENPSPIVSLCAARALAQIDPPRAMALFVPMIASREDWFPGSVARILTDNHDGSAARELSSVLMRANTDTAATLVRLLARVAPAQAAGVVRQLLDAKVDDHVISVCLQLLDDPQDRERARRFLDSPRWHVRMHAAAALGRMGDPGDRSLLEPLLSDSVWWVRYRTAQALLVLPGMGAQALLQIKERLADAYGRDIIDHVLSEHRLGITS